MHGNSSKLPRTSTRLAIAGLVLAVLSSVCGSCIAAVADRLPPPAQDSSGDCHPEHPGTQDNRCDCACPVLVSAGHSDLDAAVAEAPRSAGDEIPVQVAPPPANRFIRLAGELRPGGLPAVPRLSPIRSFCIRLE